MQYILSQEEYTSLVSMKENRLLKDTKKLQELCTKIANKMPVHVTWIKTPDVPWGCILEGCQDYCDYCPVPEICPNTYKQWSK